MVDNILMDFSKDLTLVIYFDLKDTVVSVVTVQLFQTEKNNKEENQIKLFFKDTESGRDMYRYYKLGVIFTTDYYRTD
ncbi:UNKNOWN [Stylonychia lemnae]|uniref:Uncharacterized protein n=1 Tax=Stylonychia lemnae TaxID=5949 RepID=A0A078AJM4_STYLE|nr:UNKNOWN [Stylonychia lemnae]|eukprot:CDW82091.1 UNKNOWN [Stylonychia lemnae]